MLFLRFLQCRGSTNFSVRHLCSNLPIGRIFVKGNRFLSFAKNIGKNISKHLSDK